jgi:hypothetical protein
MRAAPLALLVAACSCGATTAGGPAAGEPFTEWGVAGLTLTRQCESVPDDSRCWVTGVDGDGHALDGAALFVRAAAEPGVTPAEMARRAECTLFDEAGAEPVAPGLGERRFVSAAEDAVVTAPAVESGRLVYFRMDGEMSPTLQRVVIELASGTVVERRPATEVVALTSPGEPACEPVATCGCEIGCRTFVRVTTASGERFRDADGALWYRPDAGHPLRTVDEEACEEACRPEPARRRCAVIEGVCGEAP